MSIMFVIYIVLIATGGSIEKMMNKTLVLKIGKG
jgi:hypothetical protein